MFALSYLAENASLEPSSLNIAIAPALDEPAKQGFTWLPCVAVLQPVNSLANSDLLTEFILLFEPHMPIVCFCVNQWIKPTPSAR
jgi:hypothetical protein